MTKQRWATPEEIEKWWPDDLGSHRMDIWFCTCRGNEIEGRSPYYKKDRPIRAFYEGTADCQSCRAPRPPTRKEVRAKAIKENAENVAEDRFELVETD